MGTYLYFMARVTVPKIQHFSRIRFWVFKSEAHKFLSVEPVPDKIVRARERNGGIEDWKR